MQNRKGLCTLFISRWRSYTRRIDRMQPEGSLVFGLFGLLVFLGGRVGRAPMLKPRSSAELAGSSSSSFMSMATPSALRHFDVQGQGLHFPSGAP